MKKIVTRTSTSFAFAVAAFAVTLTSVQAFGNQEFLTKAGLSDDQVVAVQEARELRKIGDIQAARDALIQAGIDEQTILQLRQAHKQYQQHHRHWLSEQIDEKLSDDQQAALQVARAANDRETIRAILDEAGVERPPRTYDRPAHTDILE